MSGIEPNVPRRRFLKAMGIAGIGSTLVPQAMALAQTATSAAPPAATPAKPDTAAAAKPPELSEDAKALASVIQRRYGQHLTPEQIHSITSDFDGDIRAAKRLHDVKLANGDEPDFTFHA
jgi:hypothetical protein